MKSKDAIIWGLILKFGNLALVVMDTAFWQKSFASEVSATVPGYNLAAIAIFGIPWGLGTVIGLTARAIHNTPIFPSYPGTLTTAEVNSGLVMPYTVKALIGGQGIVAFFVLLFMALTSTVSSSMIAVSSILSFDVYKNYINPKASDKRLLKVSHLAVVAHAIFITGVSLALNYGGADMTWIGYFRPILSCPGIIPLALALCWKGQTRLAAILAPILGFFTGLAIWLGTAQALYGTVTLTTTEQGLPALYGACGSLFSPAIYSVLISRFQPGYAFDWREFLRIELAPEFQTDPHVSSSESSEESSISDEKKDRSRVDGKGVVVTSPEPAHLPGDETPASRDVIEPPHGAPHDDGSGIVSGAEKAAPHSSKKNNNIAAIPLDDIQHPFSAATLQQLHRWYKIAWAVFVFVVLVTFVVWPMPLYRDYVFTRSFFSSWTAVAIAWQFLAFFAVAVYPLYDGRREIAKASRGVWKATGAFLGRLRRRRGDGGS